MAPFRCPQRLSFNVNASPIQTLAASLRTVRKRPKLVDVLSNKSPSSAETVPEISGPSIRELRTSKKNGRSGPPWICHIQEMTKGKADCWPQSRLNLTQFWTKKKKKKWDLCIFGSLIHQQKWFRSISLGKFLIYWRRKSPGFPGSKELLIKHWFTTFEKKRKKKGKKFATQLKMIQNLPKKSISVFSELCSISGNYYGFVVR